MRSDEFYKWIRFFILILSFVFGFTTATIIFYQSKMKDCHTISETEYASILICKKES